ncbi:MULTISPECIES: PIG-L deacetylase family protein [unclassified Paenibacillus]|uniref:PIG-L deacetylase family protein n=1 Tax=unclassified Paenibacillus TaxID=185978 RepID=UPI001C122966|nr:MULTISPECIES: PIG-L family deacetylase [unclassified Paenibacillus]MBU5442973.1 PIG-L family deacetylase [Paenibacillus sp. MSJ-34]CAH0119478.1 1D-myo-inositol 2-acetamido-2-deoxy-alpha-D-glucopyranoside deacetylase [Paenibacillus sp. CECT 9249]
MNHTVGFIYAHPDDETFGCACLIREVADQGGKTVLLCATRGDAGKTGRLGPMSKSELAARREVELQKAGDIMGLSVIEHLGLPDGQLASYDRAFLADQIVSFINKHNPSVIVTFPEDGMSGHKDHIAIHHATNEAVFSGRCPSVQKLYYNAPFSARASNGKPPLQIEVSKHWPMKAKALLAHESQILSIERVFGDLKTIPNNGFGQYESFVLVWEKGVHHPEREDRSIFDRVE